MRRQSCGSCTRSLEGMSADPLPRLQSANAHFVTPQLLVGGDLDWDTAVAVEQLRELVNSGVTRIIDTRIEAEDADLVARFAEVSRVDLDYHRHGIDDAGQRVPAEWFDDCVGVALDAIDAGGVVLTHCHMGINRGPSLGYAVMLAQGWDPLDALARIVEVRPISYVAYAEDALSWHHTRASSSPEALAADLDRMATWRSEHGLDLLAVLRLTRPSDPPT